MTGNTAYNMQVQISYGWFAWALLAGTLYLIIGVRFAPLSVPSVFFWAGRLDR